jgi:hypothetical protein
MINETRSLQEVVGKDTYTVWTEMLKKLVPGGRTHRLAPVVAAMLQYAVMVAEKQRKGEPEANSVGKSLLSATEAYHVEGVESEIGEVVKQLFDDAGVSYERINAQGRHYSILEQALYEFINWYSMPWES